jgi:EpsI family protein
MAAPFDLTNARTFWLPTAVLTVGCAANFFVGAQRTMTLTAPLTTLPMEVEGHQGVDTPIGEEEARVAGATTSLLRAFTRDSSEFQIYVGFYASQKQGKTIHSPKNCLPGAGWEPLESRRETVATATGTEIRVNRFVIANKTRQALVYYWYQGRGRTESSEYQVKFDLMRDSALKRRSDEALVRLVIPLRGNLPEAEAMARRIVSELYGDLTSILPG